MGDNKKPNLKVAGKKSLEKNGRDGEKNTGGGKQKLNVRGTSTLLHWWRQKGKLPG